MKNLKVNEYTLDLLANLVEARIHAINKEMPNLNDEFKKKANLDHYALVEMYAEIIKTLND